MTDKSTLLALAERCEKASGPDRELDAVIFHILGMPLPEQFFTVPIQLDYDELQHSFSMPIGDMQVRYEHPAYTASIGAALTLRPNEHSWAAGDCNEDDLPWACITDMAGGDYVGTAATPALAFTAASLRARAGGE